MKKIKTYVVNIGGFESVIVKATSAADAIRTAGVLFQAEFNRARGERKSVRAAAVAA